MSFCAAIILLALTVYTLQSPISEKSLTDYGIKCLRITTHGRLEKYFKDETGLYWKEFKCKDKDVLYCDNVFSNQPRRRLFCQKECCPEFHPSTTMMPLISSGPATVSAASTVYAASTAMPDLVTNATIGELLYFFVFKYL